MASFRLGIGIDGWYAVLPSEKLKVSFLCLLLSVGWRGMHDHSELAVVLLCR